LSSAQILWDNWNKYDELDNVYRQGFLKIRAYGYGTELKELIDKFHVETTLMHSARVAMLFSDMMDLWPDYFKGIDKYAALKVALNHDIGELTVGDIVDDGRKEHDDKKDPEFEAVLDHFFKFHDEDYIRYKEIYRDFEEHKTFIGQAMKMIDKLDFLAKLIKMEGQGYDLSNDAGYSTNDLRLADEINRYDFVDIIANHFRHLMYDHDFDKRLIQIAVQFITCGLRSIDRPFFKWWRPTRPY